MKIAVLLCGHLRQYKKLHKNFQENVIAPFQQHGQVDTFISTWDTTNTTDCFSFKEGERSSIDLVNADEVKNLYQTPHLEIEKFEDVCAAFSLNKLFPDNKRPESKQLHNGDVLFSASMFYKWKCANELKNRIGNYDLVFRTRPDVYYFRPIDLSQIDPNFVYYRQNGYDWLHLSNTANNNILCSTFDSLVPLFQKHTFHYYPEEILELHCQGKGLKLGVRKELGEDSCLLWPRQFFYECCNNIFTRHGKPGELGKVINYFEN